MSDVTAMDCMMGVIYNTDKKLTPPCRVHVRSMACSTFYQVYSKGFIPPPPAPEFKQLKCNFYHSPYLFPRSKLYECSLLLLFLITHRVSFILNIYSRYDEHFAYIISKSCNLLRNNSVSYFGLYVTLVENVRPKGPLEKIFDYESLSYFISISPKIWWTGKEPH
jgi:hypothetical protein